MCKNSNVQTYDAEIAVALERIDNTIRDSLQESHGRQQDNQSQQIEADKQQKEAEEQQNDVEVEVQPAEIVDINQLMQDVKDIKQNQNQSIELFKNLLAAINTKCDQLLSKNTDTGNCSAKAVNIDSLLIGFTLPASNIEDAKKLNDILSDKKQRRLVKDKILMKVGKNDGEVDGHYLNKVGNELFTPQLLNSFTYKGISRNGSVKESFVQLKNIMTLFNEILCQVSPGFNMMRTEKYIQSKLLRHSGSRLKRFIGKQNQEADVDMAAEEGVVAAETDLDGGEGIM